MKIKINEKVLCLPPYISTTWDQVSALRVEHDAASQADILLLSMNDGTIVRVPHLDSTILQAAFAAHLKYLESHSESSEKPHSMPSTSEMQIGGLPIRFAINGVEGLGAALQHNPAQANSPPLPKEIINKIAGIAKIIGPEEATHLPKPEEGCNCMHCQIARAMQQGLQHNEELIEEEVTEEDLKFRTWDVSQQGDKLYMVTNPLDSHEHYNVYLGEPIGCTCGHKNCEHVRAVLNS